MHRAIFDRDLCRWNLPPAPVFIIGHSLLSHCLRSLVTPLLRLSFTRTRAQSRLWLTTPNSTTQPTLIHPSYIPAICPGELERASPSKPQVSRQRNFRLARRLLPLATPMESLTTVLVCWQSVCCGPKTSVCLVATSLLLFRRR